MQLLKVALENELDLTLAYKKSIKVAELIGLSRSTQTAFATAVSEVCREVIDKTHDGLVALEIHNEGERHHLAAVITYRQSENIKNLEEGFQYARKLVPIFLYAVAEKKGTIQLKMGIPKTAGINKTKMLMVSSYFEHLEPSTPYEEVRQKNQQLFLINEQSEQALQQAEYLNQQKNEFLSVASHELKTPLTILRAYTQMALKTDCSPITLSHLKKVDDQASKLQTMITQLLDVSKIEDTETEYNFEATASRQYLLDMKDLIMQLVPAHQLLIHLNDNSTLNIDRLRIEQVIMNIIGNAAKYSLPGTQIIFTTELQANEEVLFSVQDQGIGMSEEELIKIFKKFYRVESIVKQYNGLGIGLFISSKIINNHGGKIWVESVSGQGCTFFFTLPVYKK